MNLVISRSGNGFSPVLRLELLADLMMIIFILAYKDKHQWKYKFQ